MGRKSKNPYAGIEQGLIEANREIIRWNRNDTHQVKTLVERIVKKILTSMKKESPTVFAKFSPKIFGGGSSYEGLKVGEPGEFDMDILLKIPECTTPVLFEDKIPGHVQLKLTSFENLKRKEPDLHKAITKFVDDDNYLLNLPLQRTLMQSIFDQARLQYFPDGVINVGQKEFEISRAQMLGPALTLTIEGVNLDFFVKMDLVPCILLTKKFWPQNGFRSNPYKKPSDFFIVPKQPKKYKDHPHLDRYFRLSFQMQERIIISDRFWMKPSIRIIKRMRDCLKHNGISSYAIKTLFMWELSRENPDLGPSTPTLRRGSFSDCLMHMLDLYLRCLRNHRISYFWHEELSLLDSLTYQQIEHYKNDVERMIADIKTNPTSGTILKYLRE